MASGGGVRGQGSLPVPKHRCRSSWWKQAPLLLWAAKEAAILGGLGGPGGAVPRFPTAPRFPGVGLLLPVTPCVPTVQLTFTPRTPGFTLCF